MKATVVYQTGTTTETIDLVDFGYQEDVRFEDLTENEQLQIEDNLRDQNYIRVVIKTING